YYARNLGLLPRTSSAEDPLAPIVVGDDDVLIITRGMHKLAATPERERWQLLPDPFAARLAASRAALRAALESADAARLGLARIVVRFGLGGPLLDAFLLALAPDLDLRVPRLFGFLNNDASQRRPTLGHLEMAVQPHLPAIDAGFLGVIDGELVARGLLDVDA